MYKISRNLELVDYGKTREKPKEYIIEKRKTILFSSHLAILHGSSCLKSPLQYVPTSFLVFDLILVLIPPSHGLLHSEKLHEPHSQKISEM